jgi:hypothetical protein
MTTRSSADSAWLAYLRHDSVVIDSIARTIDTDSLYRLNHALLSVLNIRETYQAAICERTRLARTYGIRPSRRAVERMEDTLWRHEKDAERRIEARMPASTLFDTSERACGPRVKIAADSVDGVSLQFAPSRSRWKLKTPG